MNKNDQQKGKAGQAGTYTQTGFTPKPPKPVKKPITLLDILLGKR